MVLIFNTFRYHKFVKSKDLSMKSDTDMDCVFGKRRKKRKRTKSENESDGGGSKEQQKVMLWSCGIKLVQILLNGKLRSVAFKAIKFEF